MKLIVNDLEAKRIIATNHNISFDQVLIMGTPQGTFFNYINDGEKLNAIKCAREILGWGLKESKDFVDALEKVMQQTIIEIV